MAVTDNILGLGKATEPSLGTRPYSHIWSGTQTRLNRAVIMILMRCGMTSIGTESDIQ